MTGVELILEAFENSQTLAVSGMMQDGLNVSIDASAVAQFNVQTSVMRSVFKFQTDASDVDTALDGTDVLYYVIDASWNTTTHRINPANAVMVDGAIGSGWAADRNLVKHDFVRYIAQQMFNTHHAVDLLSNEDDLKHDIASKGSDIWTAIQGILTTAGGSSPFNNSNDSNNNISRKILRQLHTQAKARFISDGTTSTVSDSGLIQSVPFHDGDILSFKVSLSMPASQTRADLSALSAKTRTYKIKLVLVSGAHGNTTPNDVYNGSADATFNAQYPNWS